LRNFLGGFSANVTDGSLTAFYDNDACRNGEGDGVDYSAWFGAQPAIWTDNDFRESLEVSDPSE
jgi:hypothetical protein